jgi:hypothetical protein
MSRSGRRSNCLDVPRGESSSVEDGMAEPKEPRQRMGGESRRREGEGEKRVKDVL